MPEKKGFIGKESTPGPHSVAPEVIVTFLKKIMPFKILEEDELHAIGRHCRIDFFPKGSRLMTVDETVIHHLYLIQRGGVKAFLFDGKGEEVLKDYRGEGAYVGALGIIRGTRANLNIETIEDTFCFLLPREVFLGLVKSNIAFSHFYLKSFSDQVVSTAYKELRHQNVSMRSSEELYLFTITAGDLAKPVQKMPLDATIQQVALEMARLRIGSMLLHDPGDVDDIVGIITDTDLRMKVVAIGRDYSEPVENIMSMPVHSVLAEEICFEVLLKMMASGIRHLAVEKGGRTIGVLTSHDVMVLQGSSPFYLFKEIIKQRQIEGIYPIASKVPGIVRNLIREGGKAGSISRMISLLNDQIVRQVLMLLEKEVGEPPVSYCWLFMGSEGRREQTFLTDQDNAIVYADPYSPEKKAQVETYFREFAAKAIEHLSKCGYPLCPSEVMATNPKWCQPFSVWQSYFAQWITEASQEDLLDATLFFDFRAGYGDDKLAASLRNHIIDLARRQQGFILNLARNCQANKVPLTFFRNFIVERNGEHRNHLDIKLRGLIPIIGFARLLALQHGLKETNTIARLEALQGEGYIPVDLCNEAVKAFELQMQLRIVHQLDQIERQQQPDNYIEPQNLTAMERTMLKEAFEIIEKLQALLERRFVLN
jgi:CBS domain-containing protein